MQENNSTTKNKHPIENVWDFPRPPRIEKWPYRILIKQNGEVIVDTENAHRILETSHPPTYYIPFSDINSKFLKPITKSSFCEFKGIANYYDVVVGDTISKAGCWQYKKVSDPKYLPLEGGVAFYCRPGINECYVDDELAKPQEGMFYGGWISSFITGGEKGIKGAKGTEWW